MKPNDWIALIEAGYSLEGSDQTWLMNILDYVAPLFKRGFWPTFGTYNYTPMSISLESTATNGLLISVHTQALQGIVA